MCFSLLTLTLTNLSVKTAGHDHKKNNNICINYISFFSYAEKRSKQNEKTKIAFGVKTTMFFVTKVSLVVNKTQGTGQNLIEHTWKVL